MTPQQIARFLDTIGCKPGPRSGHWIHIRCPFAGDHQSGVDRNPSFGIKIMPGDSRVHCFSCNFSGTCGDVVVALQRKGLPCRTGDALDVIIEAEDGAPLELAGGDYEEDVFSGPPQPHVYPEEVLGAFERAYWQNTHAVAEGGWADVSETLHPYLTKRGVTFEVAEWLDLRWDTYRYRIVFPVRDFEGRLRGLHGRHADGFDWAPDDTWGPYKMYPFDGATNPHVWLGEHWVDLDRPVLLAESVFDLARCLEVYPNVMSPLTAGLNEARLARLSGAFRVVSLFDADKAGDGARKRLRDLNCRVDHVRLPPGTDAGDTPAALLAEYLYSHLPEASLTAPKE